MEFSPIRDKENDFLLDVLERIELSNLYKQNVVAKMLRCCHFGLDYNNFRVILSHVLSLIFLAQSTAVEDILKQPNQRFLYLRKTKEREVVFKCLTKFFNICFFTLEPLSCRDFCEEEFCQTLEEFENIFYHDFFDGMFTDEAVGALREIYRQVKECARDITTDPPTFIPPPSFTKNRSR